MNDLKFAIPAALFFSTLAVLLFIHGSHIVQATIAMALFVGALGQFLAQDTLPVAQVVAWAMSWVAILLSAVAVITFIAI